MNECAMVRDLIPLYEDNECSNESREFVEKHMAKCPSCKTFLKEIKASKTLIIPREEVDYMEPGKSFLVRYKYRLIFLFWALLLLGYTLPFIVRYTQATGASISFYLQLIFPLVLIGGLIVIGFVVIVKAIKWAVKEIKN